jgi:hypothetical protein
MTSLHDPDQMDADGVDALYNTNAPQACDLPTQAARGFTEPATSRLFMQEPASEQQRPSRTRETSGRAQRQRPSRRPRPAAAGRARRARRSGPGAPLVQAIVEARVRRSVLVAGAIGVVALTMVGAAMFSGGTQPAQPAASPPTHTALQTTAQLIPDRLVTRAAAQSAHRRENRRRAAEERRRRAAAAARRRAATRRAATRRTAPLRAGRARPRPRPRGAVRPHAIVITRPTPLLAPAAPSCEFPPC